MNAFYKPPFRKFVKKQDRAFQLIIEDEVEKISRDFTIGEEKSGDLSGFRVHKFKFRNEQYLIAYKSQVNDIIFYMIGTHENFYRDIKRYLREED